MQAFDFDALFDRVSTWGRWGDDDQRGTLHHISDPAVVAAASLVRTGRSISLGHDLDRDPGPDNARPVEHRMTGYAAAGGTEPAVNTDYVGMDFHGKSVTHLDALCHCVFRGRIYNGYLSEEHVGERGGDLGNVSQMAQGVVTRGVLVDVPRSLGLPWLDPGTVITADDLESALEAQRLSLQPGDAVLVRTGARARKDALGAWDPSNLSAGLGPDCMPVLSRGESALLGSDGDSDARPSPVPGVFSPIHALALNAMGMPLIDNMLLEDLAVVCADLERWEFLFVLAPLRIPGGTGSPVNPLAVL